MNANLMCAPGLQFHIQQRESMIVLSHFVQGYCAAAASHHCHSRAITRIARKWLVNTSRRVIYTAVNERNVRLKDCAIAKLFREVLERFFSFCNYKQTGCVAIQTVNNAWSDRACARW